MILNNLKKILKLRIFRYLFSGGLAAVVDLGLLFVLAKFFHVWYLLSAVVAFLVAFVFSFLLQKFVTFEDISKKWITFQVVTYLVIAIFNLFINTFLMYIAVDVFYIYYMWAQFFINAIIALYSFFMYKYLVFCQTNL